MADAEPQIIDSVEAGHTGYVRVMKDIAAGTCGGIAQVLVGQPFDTTKVRLQSAPPGTYSGALDVVKQLLKTEGPRGFYKGTLTPLVGVGACVSIQFGVFQGMKRFFSTQNGSDRLTPGQIFVSGAAAGVANSVLASPIEHVRIRLQTQTVEGAFSGPMDVIRQLWAADGLRGIYRGLMPTILREGNGMGLYFLTYESLVMADMDRLGVRREDIPGYRLCGYGALAGYSVWILTYQFDVIKSKLQTDALNPAERQYRSMLQCARHTIATAGVGGLFRGFVPTMLRAAPANASTFLAFELAIRAMG
ncbi:mitochondrial carrier domain-containing protein [Dipodascopsis tothii]|uniref:mitochondrial carrier domain-containing protein n=1 Tax=Dipodascopsis tothii TaxID=44089 RepID=UPI0034CF0071